MKHALVIVFSFMVVFACGLITVLAVPGLVMAKTAGEKPPASMVYAETVARNPETAALVEALRAAKRAGDEEQARSLARELGWVSAPDSEHQAKANPDYPRDVYRTERAKSNGIPGGDVMVNEPGWMSNNPAMASTRDGVLYVVVDDVRPGQNYIDIYSSNNDGYSWTYNISIQGGSDLTNPSIAIGEGNVNRLLIAYESARETADTAIFVRWQDLDTGSMGNVAVENYPLWLYNPQICVDSSEYANWWPYLTYTKGVLTKQDRYDLLFTRSLDYGDSWQAPSVLATGVAGDCKPDIDFGEPGLYLAYTRYEASLLNNVYLLRSLDLGSNWDPELALAQSDRDETDPRVAATKGGGAVAVAFTREYTPTDTDIDAYVSQDSGETWATSFPPYTGGAETTVDLEVSPELGRIHAAFWSEHDIHYTWANWDSPGLWAPLEIMNDSGAAATGVRPTVAVNPTKEQEVCVAWTDTRVELQYNVFFNAPYPLGDYLIIVAHNGLMSAVEPLVLWKQQLGYNMLVIDLADIYAGYPNGDDAERIWSFLHDRHEGLKYVMLVGDIDLLPMRILYPDGDPGFPPSDPKHHNGMGYGTDYYYAEHTVTNWDLDGDNRWGEFTDDAFDFTPELIIGRLPFNDPVPVQAICSNIVNFEQDTGAWKRNALLAHGFASQASGASAPASDCADMADFMRSNLLQPNGWTTTTLFERVGLGQSAYSSTADLSQTNYENYCGLQTYGVVNCFAHGNGDLVTGVRWLYDLNGSGYCDLVEESGWNPFSRKGRIPGHPAQSVIFLNGCSTAPIIGDDPDFMPSPLRSRYLVRISRENLAFKEYLLHGAAGLVGSSAGSEGTVIWNSPADGNASSLGYYFYHHLINDGLPVGDAFHRAHHTYVQNHTLQRSMRVFNYYGDPSLVLPGVPTAKRNGLVAAGSSIPGLLSPDIALATALDWQRKSSEAGSDLGLPVVSSAKSPEEASIWTECADIPAGKVVTSLLQTPAGDVFGTGVAARVSGGTKGVILHSENGWDPWTITEIEGLLSARTIFKTASGALLLGGMTGTLPSDYHAIIYRSTDGGQTWNERFGTSGGVVTDICQDAAGTLWAVCGLNGFLVSSIDDGISWNVHVVLSGGPHFSSIMQASNGRYFATLEFTGYLSIIESDNCTNWYPVGGLGTTESVYEIVEVDGHLYAGVAAADGGWVYRSDDLSGESWQRLDPFPVGGDVTAVRSLAVDSEGTIFAGISVSQASNITHVYTMNPAEGVWREYGGLVDEADRVTAILPVSGTVYIGTGSAHGNIYRCLGKHVSSVPDSDQTPSYEFKMDQNFPNPFNPSTTIAYELPQGAPVKLGIYDVSGRLVRLLRNGSFENAGRHEATWDGRDGSGRMLSAGVYVYRLEAGSLKETRRMVLVK